VKRYVFLLCAALILGSCHMQPKEDNSDEFWAIDFTKKPGQSGYFYQAKARQLYEGDKCIIYAETNSAVNVEDAKQFASEYCDKIYGVMLEYFCEKNFEVDYNGTKTTYADTLEYAFSLVNNQDKLLILLLDIKDGYKPGKGYVAGYFHSINLYDGLNSNFKNMIYVDTYPGLRNMEEMYSTFAHELQHLINYVTGIRKRPNGQSPYPRQMDTWIDEGLSLMAEHLYQEMPLKKRIDWFIEDREGSIARGNNFFVWDNHQDLSSDTVLDDYATAYLFFQWLFLHSEDGPALLKAIVNSSESDYQAVAENTASIISDGGDWETLLRTWLAANYINHSTNEYGYKGDAAFNDIKVKTYQLPNDKENKKIDLYPGEGVYSTINSTFTLPADDPSGTNIRYAGLQKAASIVDASGSPYTGDMLLTFNIKTIYRRGDTLESGYFTGEDAPAAAHTVERAVAGFSYPVRIDARDFMRRNGEPTQLKSVPSKARLPANEQ